MKALLRNIFLNIVGFVKHPQAGIHIINSHFVTPNQFDSIDFKIYEDFLKYLTSFGKLITLEEATKRIIKNDIPQNKVLISLTYDDGFEECYSTIAPLLEKYNARGSFFINANYIDSSIEYRNDYNERTKTYTKKPMSWNQVVNLHQRGHLIGSHTLDHVDMTKLDENELIFQLKENKRILEQKLNYSCDYFAWTYGQLKYFSEEILKNTFKYHKYIFSGTNYKNYFSYNGKAINRRHIESFWNKRYINYFLSSKKHYNETSD